MSIYKWFDDEETKERRKKKEEFYDSLPKEKKQELKKETIKKVIKKEDEIQPEIGKKEYNEFLHDVIEFKEWLDARTYLKGDIDRIETWIKILYKKVETYSKKLSKENERETLIEEFRKIPPEFLEEKTRIALNKKLRGDKTNSSDNYYLRKLKTDIERKLAQAKYYKIIMRIFEM